MSIGPRLKEERERIGLTQAALGAVGGIQKQAQLKYESGVRTPSAEYLIEISKIGIDVNYVLFGVRSNAELTSEEQQLLETFRAAPPAVRQFMLGGIVSSVGMKIEGNHNQQYNHTDADKMEIKGDNNVQIARKSRKK
ncbi:helix-turn-helix domain-containing protein [Aggregatibacter actinomycetemcomitans]|uniref:helix-turn-helix domain-containing protein n=1 Tax=Aggregatibacter actinomycetemcomitans TaxID=714 RepID=UPI001E5625A9|nr:helix-turn-helix transcriptional regulator [Aggregatibacter actinomycetemcomitans]DAY11749.1 MAG TPA: helix-turn-helix domain protein [Caudoviricetes sp.]